MHSSRMRTARSSSRGGSPPGAPPGTMHPPVDRHTPVNILPCPKLRLRAVNILNILKQVITRNYRKTDVNWV